MRETRIGFRLPFRAVVLVVALIVVPPAPREACGGERGQDARELRPVSAGEVLAAAHRLQRSVSRLLARTLEGPSLSGTGGAGPPEALLQGMRKVSAEFALLRQDLDRLPRGAVSLEEAFVISDRLDVAERDLERLARELGVAGGETGARPTPWIDLLYPNGGERWETDRTYRIRWASQGVIGGVKILIQAEGEPNAYPVTPSAPNTGSFVYRVPEGIGVDTFTIRVMSLDGKAGDASEGTVHVVPPAAPSIRVLSPRGGEAWEMGKVYGIRWSSTGPIDRVRVVRVDADSGHVRPVHCAGVVTPDNSGYCVFRVPFESNDGCLFKVTSEDGAVKDTSDGPVTFVPPAGLECDVAEGECRGDCGRLDAFQQEACLTFCELRYAGCTAEKISGTAARVSGILELMNPRTE